MKRMLITGPGCSATTYMAKVLKLCGLDIEHEQYPDETTHSVSFRHLRMAEKYDVILNQIRNFRKSVTGIYYRWNDAGWRDSNRVLRKYTDTELLLPWENHRFENTVKHVYYFHTVAEEKAKFSYRIEDCNSDLIKKICSFIDVTPQNIEQALNKVPTNQSSKSKYHNRNYFSWKEIKGVREGRRLTEEAKRWNYLNRSA